VKALALVQVATYGAALEAANMVTNREKLELVEIIPFGTFTQLLIQGPYSDLMEYRKALRTADLQKSVIINEPDPRLIKAYYHLENQKSQNYILILEHEFAGYLLEWGQALFKKNLQIMDFRQPRFPGAQASLVMTGKSMDFISEEMRQMESQKIKVSFVEEPTTQLKKYFEIEA
jgi:hypothetical protein